MPNEQRRGPLLVSHGCRRGSWLNLHEVWWEPPHSFSSTSRPESETNVPLTLVNQFDWRWRGNSVESLWNIEKNPKLKQKNVALESISIAGLKAPAAVVTTANRKQKCECHLLARCHPIWQTDSGRSKSEADSESVSWEVVGGTRLPVVSVMNRGVKSLTCDVQTARTMSSLSARRSYKLVWEKGVVENFLSSWGLMLGNFFGKEKRTESIKRYKLFLGSSFWGQNWLCKWLSSAAGDTLQEVPGAIGTGSVEKIST